MWSRSKSEVVDISDEPLWDEMRQWGGSLKPTEQLPGSTSIDMTAGDLAAGGDNRKQRETEIPTRTKPTRQMDVTCHGYFERLLMTKIFECS